MARRWLAKRPGPAGAWLHTNLPLDGEPETQLSGAGSFKAVLPTYLRTLRTDDGLPLFLSWGTELYLEEADVIRWGGIVTWAGEDGAEWTIEASQFGAYPYGQDYREAIREFNYDPANVVRRIWAHLQSFADGNLGVEVVGSTTSLVGNGFTEKMKEGAVRERNPDGTYKPLRDDQKVFTPDPYELHWSDAPDCGREIASLAEDAPFEWIEQHAWADESKSSIVHRILIADKHGSRNEDIRFTVGVNVTEPVPVDDDGDDYASDVNVIGSGEGDLSVRSRPMAVVVPGRLRRGVTIEAKAEKSVDRVTRIAADALRRAQVTLAVSRIMVTQHEDAPIGSWQLGDEVPVVFPSSVLAPRADGTAGQVVAWFRIVSWVMISETEAELELVAQEG